MDILIILVGQSMMIAYGVMSILGAIAIIGLIITSCLGALKSWIMHY